MGFTRHLVGDLEGAIEFYHQALSRKPDDPFSSQMLNRALNEALDNMGPSSSIANTTNGSLGLQTSPMTPANRSSMSMGSTMSSIKFQGNNNSATTGNGRYIFSPGDSDVDMSLV